MDQENKLLKEREKERSELMNLDLNDSENMITHLDLMKEKYLKMKNNNETEFKQISSRVLDLTKEKHTLSDNYDKLKKEEKKLQEEAKILASTLEKNKDQSRQEIEKLRRELDTQQKKAKQATIDYTEARNELLELKQAKAKCDQDQKEIKNDYETRLDYLETLAKKLKTQKETHSNEILELKKQIFETPD